MFFIRRGYSDHRVLKIGAFLKKSTIIERAFIIELERKLETAYFLALILKRYHCDLQNDILPIFKASTASWQSLLLMPVHCYPNQSFPNFKYTHFAFLYLLICASELQPM